MKSWVSQGQAVLVDPMALSISSVSVGETARNSVW